MRVNFWCKNARAFFLLFGIMIFCDIANRDLKSNLSVPACRVLDLGIGKASPEDDPVMRKER